MKPATQLEEILATVPGIAAFKYWDDEKELTMETEKWRRKTRSS